MASSEAGLITLLINHSPWSQHTYTILDNISSRGSHSAKLIQQGLSQLDDELSQLLVKNNIQIAVPTGILPAPEAEPDSTKSVDSVPTAAAGAYLAEPRSIDRVSELSGP